MEGMDIKKRRGGKEVLEFPSTFVKFWDSEEGDYLVAKLICKAGFVLQVCLHQQEEKNK